MTAAFSFGSLAEIMKLEMMPVPMLRAPSGSRRRIPEASRSSQPVTRSSRADPSENRSPMLRVRTVRIPSGALSARFSIQPESVSMAPRAVCSSWGRIPARRLSSRTAAAHRSITVRVRKQKDRQTPIPAAAVRGRRSFLHRKPTRGSAASARAKPSKNGRNRGRKYRTIRKVPQKIPINLKVLPGV